MLSEFLERAKKVRHEYDFSLVKEYVNNRTKISVICHEKDFCGNEHGMFMITPANLLRGRGCPKCKGVFTSDERKEFCNKLHNGKYNYTKSDFSKVKTKTIVTCPVHGDFEIDFDHHFNGHIGCKQCSRPVFNTETFIKEANKKHDFKYDYSKTEYKTSHEKVIIICPEHGEFIQTPNAHLNGEGCPVCAKNLRVLENTIENLLKDNKIVYIKDYKPTWLKRNEKSSLSLDFYLPEFNTAIECQGKQHFGYGGWSKKYDFAAQKERDEYKRIKCKENSVRLIYYTNKNNFNGKNKPPEFDDFFIDEKKLLKYL